MRTGGPPPLSPSADAESCSAARSNRALTLISWIPLLAGVASSYGPVALNYGFALYFLNYRHGFVKRGLVGTFVESIPYFTRDGLIALEYGFIFAGFGLTYFVLRRLFFGNAQDRALVATLFARLHCFRTLEHCSRSLTSRCISSCWSR